MATRGKRSSGLLTQQKMMRSALALFAEKGYDDTTTAEIARGAGMTPSSFFRAFTNKEALLLELVRWAFDRQYELVRNLAQSDDLGLLCASELALELHIAEMSEPLRELCVTVYTLPSTSGYIHRAMSDRLHRAFSRYCPDAQAKDFYELELALAGMLRSYMVIPCDVYFTLEAKAARCLDCALRLMNVGARERKELSSAVQTLNLRKAAEEALRTACRESEDGLDLAKPTAAYIPRF